MIRRLLETLAPHTPADELDPGETDGGFWSRVHDAEAEDGRPSLWERSWTPANPRLGYPNQTLRLGWALTKVGLGVDVESDLPGPHERSGPGFASVVLALGPLYLSWHREYLSPAAQRFQVDEARRAQNVVLLENLGLRRRTS